MVTYQQFRSRRYGSSILQPSPVWGIAKRLLGQCAVPSTQEGGPLTKEEADEQPLESPGGPDCMQCSICLDVIPAPDGVALPGHAASDSTAQQRCEAGDAAVEHVSMVRRRRVQACPLAGLARALKRLARATTLTLPRAVSAQPRVPHSS